MMLNVEKLNTYYGQSHILFDVALTVGQGEVVSLLGRNGAGKTTSLRSIMGLTPPRSGTVSFEGKPLQGEKPNNICRKGIAFVPEDRRIFSRLTVHENLEIGAIRERRNGPWSIKRVYELFPRLNERRHNLGHQLSGGEQQMLTIGRALMGNPSLILLDEPSEGLAPVIVTTVGDVIRTVRDEGISILLVEQNSSFACRLSDRAYLIDDGRIRFHGTIDELEQNSELKQKYLAV
ncbi:ABC transporter ATP-binding protein [Nitratireductor sp. XY-223]|uniref:ABC transporter ATP-binding protein n=1 Tax=Nitratireductor sp. XY-223 TaxID=2561926 RepID=UPI0019817420|nr:ABC transporter ATP-binding protein [Nitratireductor sp. XY-223]